jgi:hypothetical protein
MAFTVREKLENIKNDAATEVANILSIKFPSLNNFSAYTVGFPDIAEQNEFAIYPDETIDSDILKEFNILCQLQLPIGSVLDSYDYQQAVYEYFVNIDPGLIGFQSRGEIRVENFPGENQSGAIILFTVKFELSVDDCNYDKPV